MAVIKIEIVFDIVCAWCYIGKRTLDKAISIHQKTYPGGKNDIFHITWRPYYLNYTRLLLRREELPGGGGGDDVAAGSSTSSLPSAGTDDMHYYSTSISLPTVDKSELEKVKLGQLSAGQVDALRKRVNQIGRSLGVSFRPGGKIGSTRAAHHLIHLAQREQHITLQEEIPKKKDEDQEEAEEARHTALVERLFEAYHELEMDISARDVLRKIAVDDVHLDPVEVDECLGFCFDSSPFASPRTAAAFSVNTANGSMESVVDKEARENRRRTSTGVPLFIIQGDYGVEGAQDLMEFLEIFRRIREIGDI